MKQSILIILLLMVAPALGAKLPGAPKCDVNESEEIPDKGDAGCLIKADGKLVMIRHSKGGQMGIPGGKSEPGESAQCTAHRESWEETGLDVRVGKLLQKFKNGFHVFRCEAKTLVTTEDGRLPLPEWSKNEVTEVWLINPETVSKKDYRFPKQLEDVRSLFNSL